MIIWAAPPLELENESDYPDSGELGITLLK